MYINDLLTERIIRCFFVVYNMLGPGLLESVYHKGMVLELRANRLFVETEKRISVFYLGENIGDYRADLLVEGSVIVECKCVEKIATAHVAQVVTYLKATNLNTGLILNFGPDPTIRRVSR